MMNNKKKKLLTLIGCVLVMVGTAFTAACDLLGNSIGGLVPGGHTHSYTETITKQATCADAGERTFSCKCGDSYTEAIPATGHDYKVESTIAATCTEAEKEQIKCSYCGNEEIRTKEGGQAALGHEWVTDAIIPATCDEPEKAVQSCHRDGCDATQTVNKEGGQAALGHHYVADESTRTAPDCTHDGGVTMKCDHEGCTESYWDVIPSLGHTDDGTKNEVYAPTCEEEGYTIHHCLVCDVDYKTDNVAPLGHDYLADGYVTASCNSIGYDRFTCSHECGTEKRENVVQNTEHTFNEQGVCTGCGKRAPEAMALIAKTSTPIEIISQGKGLYEVYGMREKEHVVYIPYNLIQALVKQGVESIIINVGAATPSDPISVLTKIDGETALTANFGAGQMGEVATIRIAENGQVASSITSDGIALTVFYHDNNLNKVNRYVIGLTYVQAFDSENVQTWYQTSLDVSGEPEDKIHVFSGMEDQAYYKVSVRPELVQYYAEQGATSLQFSFISKEGQRVIFVVDYTIGDKGVTLPAANNSLDVPELAITDEMLQSGVTFRILFADCSLMPDWASANLDRADGFRLQTLLVKAYNESDASTYFDSAASWTANSELNEFTFSNCDIGNNTIIKIRPEYFTDLANKGFAQAVITLSNKSGQDLTFSVVLEGTNHMAKGSVSFTLDITDELKTNGISLPVYTSDNGGNADGFVMRIDKVYAFDENNPVTFISAMGTDGVAYADNAWTFDKTVTSITGPGDYYQNFTISQQIVVKWLEDGYGKMKVAFAPKAGESMDMRFDVYQWEVNLADYLDEGFTKAPFVAPRTEPGITGFVITIELIKECPHEWDTDNIVWTWNGYTSATAEIVCLKGDHPETVTASVALTSETPATCTEDGAKIYTATITFNGQDYTDTKTETLNKLGHNYDTANIVWTWDGYTGATAKIVCLKGDHPETVTATVELTSETPATCTENGQNVYTATIAFNNQSYTDTKTETLTATGHSYGDWVVVQEATADADGSKEKVCSVCNDKVTESIPALGHTFDTENILWSWEGYSAAKATFTCTTESGHTVPVTAGIAVVSETPATCTQDGEKVYTAMVAFNGQNYTDTKTETLTATGHSYGAPVRVEPTEAAEGSITETCSACGDEKVTKIPAYLNALGTDAVVYENGVWTFAKNATADFNQQIDVSKEAVAKWISEGYSEVTLSIVHKDGEILGTQGVQTKWTITLADHVDNGYSLTAYIAPRNAEGGYGTITGFCVSAEFTIAFNAEKPATYLTVPSTDGITYADGVWTVVKTAAYAADFYQDIVVSGDAIAYWMEQGYAKMTFNVSTKAGENTVIMYDAGFAHTVAFTEAMKTEGYTFSHVFIAPRSDSGMTGFNVTLELAEGFDASKIANYVTAADTEGVTYADNSWTFAKTATGIDGSSDFYQDVVIGGDLIAYWKELGYTNMSITISAKEGESFVLMDIANPTSVAITDDVVASGYTLSHFYVAPRSGNGITGFVVTVALS